MSNTTARSDEAAGQNLKQLSEENLQMAFKPKRVELTPDAPINVGYVGGVLKPKDSK